MTLILKRLKFKAKEIGEKRPETSYPLIVASYPRSISETVGEISQGTGNVLDGLSAPVKLERTEQLRWFEILFIVTCTTLVTFLNFVFVSMASGDFLWRISALDPNVYMKATTSESPLLTGIILLSTIPFARALAGCHKTKLVSLIEAGFAILLLLLTIGPFGATGAVAVATLSGAYCAMDRLGHYMRAATPPSFRIKRTLKFKAFCSLLVMGIFGIVALMALLSRPHGQSLPSNSGYSDHALAYGTQTGYLLLGSVPLLALCLMIPTLIAGSNARTHEFKPIFLLALLLQSPLLLVLLVQSVIVCPGENGFLMFIASLCGLGLTTCLIALGAGLAALSNRLEYRGFRVKEC